jgi:hypothetical protein
MLFVKEGGRRGCKRLTPPARPARQGWAERGGKTACGVRRSVRGKKHRIGRGGGNLAGERFFLCLCLGSGRRQGGGGQAAPLEKAIRGFKTPPLAIRPRQDKRAAVCVLSVGLCVGGLASKRGAKSSAANTPAMPLAPSLCALLFSCRDVKRKGGGGHPPEGGRDHRSSQPPQIGFIGEGQGPGGGSGSGGGERTRAALCGQKRPKSTKSGCGFNAWMHGVAREREGGEVVQRTEHHHGGVVCVGAEETCVQVKCGAALRERRPERRAGVYLKVGCRKGCAARVRSRARRRRRRVLHFGRRRRPAA